MSSALLKVEGWEFLSPENDDGEYLVRAVEIGKRAKYNRPRDGINKIIERNRALLERFGLIVSPRRSGAVWISGKGATSTVECLRVLAERTTGHRDRDQDGGGPVQLKIFRWRLIPFSSQCVAGNSRLLGVPQQSSWSIRP